MRKYAILTLAVSVCLIGVYRSTAAPEPKPGGDDWQLSMSFQDPQRITVKLPGEQHATTYWYVLYTVTNDTKQDVEFYPSFSLVTDTLQVTQGGADIHPRVYDAIAARHKKEFPFFAPPSKVTGPLLQGEENARTSAAVFRVFDPTADSFTVFAAGLSSEVKRVPNPAFDEDKTENADNPRFFILRRTLSISYDLPGDVSTRDQSTPIRRARAWVLR